MQMIRAHLRISGKVQGVYYRAFTRNQASELGLTGWVKNLPDGSVEAIVEGEKEKLIELIRRCTKGPPHAKVQEVKVRWESPSCEFNFFSIKY